MGEHKRVRSFLACFVGSVVLTGCATTGAIQLNAMDDPAESNGVLIEDRRPEIQTRGGSPRLLEPLYVFGDALFDPAPAAALRAALWREFGDSLGEEVILLETLAVENYFAATSRRSQSAGLTAAGQTGAGLLAMREQGGSFDAVFVSIGGQFRGKEFAVLEAEPYTVNVNRLSLDMAKNTLESRQAAQLAVNRAIKQVLGQFRVILSGGSGD